MSVSSNCDQNCLTLCMVLDYQQFSIKNSDYVLFKTCDAMRVFEPVHGIEIDVSKQKYSQILTSNFNLAYLYRYRKQTIGFDVCIGWVTEFPFLFLQSVDPIIFKATCPDIDIINCQAPVQSKENGTHQLCSLYHPQPHSSSWS